LATRLVATTLLLAIALLARPAKGAETTFGLTAIVDTVFDPLDGLDDSIGPGDVVTAEYAFETTTPPSLMIPGTTFYAGAMLCARASVEGLVFEGLRDPDPFLSTIQVSDEADVGDQYQAQLVAAMPDFNLFDVLLTAQAPSSALTSTVLPVTPPDLDAFTSRVLEIQFLHAQAAILTADITSLAVAPEPLTFPEPGRFAILAAYGMVLTLAATRPARKPCGDSVPTSGSI